MAPTLTAALPNLIAGVLLAGLALVVRTRQPRTRIRTPVVLVSIALLAFVAGDLGTLLARSPAEEDAALVLLYSGTLWTAPGLWLLANRFLEERGRAKHPSARPVLIGSIAFAALAWLVAITNPLHGAFLTPIHGARNLHHALWYLAVGGTWAVILAAITISLRVALDAGETRRTRHQASILGLGMLVPFAANVLYNSPFWRWPVDPTIPALATTAVCVAFGIYGAGLFGLSPVSFRRALASDPSGVLILGRGGQSVFVNEAARRFLLASPLRPGKPVLERLAARLETAESGEPVPPTELASLARNGSKDHAGALYRVASDDPDEPSEWIWISATPIPSRFRREAAHCFRIQDVTRLWQAEIERARLEAQVLRRRQQSRPPESEGPSAGNGDLLRATPGRTDWRASILERLARYEVFSERAHPTPREIESALTEIESDPNLCRDLELMLPERAWLEFERRLRRQREVHPSAPLH